MKNQYINIKIVHLISWGCYLTLLTVFFTSMFKFEFAFYRAFQMVILHAILFYFNTLVLMPLLVEKRKYILYFSSIVVLVIVAVGTLFLLNSYVKPFGDIVPQVKGLQQDIKHDLMGRLGEKGQVSSILLTRSVLRNFSSTIAIILFSIVYRMFFQKITEEKREAALRNEHLLSEMKFLKSQINPHFLFNAINNIYTLVYLKQDRAPTMLIKLSEMLRYMLYECNEELVPLEKEISYIKNYIELQQLKTEQHQSIVTNFNEADNASLIPPLLLIPLIENSFKHSRVEDTKTGWVVMHLTSSDKQIHFKISNSCPSMPMAKDETGGIGLENVRKRLELLYPDKYELTIDETQQEFSVILNINNK
jgi:two-component system, LytTR family, sensor kinase